MPFLPAPGKPAIDADDKKVHLQKHVGVQLNLVKDRKEKNDVDQPGAPGQDIVPGRKPDGDQAEERADEFHIAEWIFEDGYECVIYVEESQRIDGFGME